MIVDYLENIGLYSNVSVDFSDAIEFALSLKDKPIGRYEKDDYFVLVQQGETNHFQDQKFETHKKYIDVQILLEGQEYMEWQYSKKLEIYTPHCDDKDAEFYTGEGIKMKFDKTMFAIFYPTDAHKACLHLDVQTKYKKLVVKLPVK